MIPWEERVRGAEMVREKEMEIGLWLCVSFPCAH